MKNPKKPAAQPGTQGSTVFRRFIRLKNGRVLDAHAYGHKAWPIGRKK